METRHIFKKNTSLRIEIVCQMQDSMCHFLDASSLGGFGFCDSGLSGLFQLMSFDFFHQGGSIYL